MLQLVNAGLSADIQHVPLPLLALSLTENDNHLLKQSLLAEHLTLRGCSNALIERKNNAFNIDFNASDIKKAYRHHCRRR
ncbi:hypothetical protein LDO48_14015 [Pantoea agglomerans]|nr:hypothetical protein [Pantoea agglomerans]